MALPTIRHCALASLAILIVSNALPEAGQASFGTLADIRTSLPEPSTASCGEDEVPTLAELDRDDQNYKSYNCCKAGICCPL